MNGLGKQLKSILIILTPAILVLIGITTNLIQTFWSINEAQAVSLMILIIAVTLWVSELIPLFVTSFVILFLEITWLLPELKHLGIDVVKQDFFSPFFSNIILLFLGGFVLSSTLSKYGLDQRIARWILDKSGNNPSRLLIGIMLISAVLSMWMSNTATTAMMFAMVLPIIIQIPQTSNFSKALALSIPFACNLGGIATPIGTPPNAIALSYLARAGITISFADWMIITVPFMIIFLLFVWRVLLILYPPGDLKLEIHLEESPELSPKHYLVIGIFVITSLGWLTTKYHGLSTGTVGLFPIIICFGFRLLSGNDFRNLSWDVLFMLGGGLTLGVALSKSGLTSEIVRLMPTQVDAWMILALFAIIAAVMTTFMSNTATANLIVPLAISIQTQTTLLVITIAIMCSTAMALPVSTPPNAIAFGSGILKTRDMILPGLLISLFALIVILIFGQMYWKFLGI